MNVYQILWQTIQVAEIFHRISEKFDMPVVLDEESEGHQSN